MSVDPWTDPDPEPGDFDGDLTTLHPRHVEHHAGDSGARLIVLVGVEGKDARRLERLSEGRGKNVVADLLRDADRSIA
jgi:hypothetical protein